MKADGLKSGAISDHWVNNDRLSNHRMARTGHSYSFLGKTYPLRKGRFPEGKLESCAQNPVRYKLASYSRTNKACFLTLHPLPF
ncbi:MAG: hypothetical protein H6Q04_3123 [Acidobacteria bacterium]|nr:hypothetical protein [Acidobacteriota bacterium]